MERNDLLRASAMTAALLTCMGAEAMAQRRPIARPPIDRAVRPQNVILVEEVVPAEKPVEVEKPKEEAPAATPDPKPEPREPYAIGKSYATLPSGCMKLIQVGTSYYNCSGDWYQLKNGAYLAVSPP